MCDRRTATVSVPAPRWRRLYAIVPTAMLCAVVLRLTVPTPLRLAVTGAVALAAMVGTIWWVHANSAALDLLDWCDCATVSVRVIASPRARQQAVPVVVDREEPAGATLGP
ncbi:MAG TPA: hypothetical protein VGU22_11500 [Methylomirabilota bacterium]|nr:hypothetical protein [Methylomirabilota bacterium]